MDPMVLFFALSLIVLIGMAWWTHRPLDSQLQDRDCTYDECKKCKACRCYECGGCDCDLKPE